MLKEEINRIKQMMGITLNESKRTFGCQRFNNDEKKQELCLKISDLKSWLHKDDGLGMKTIINNKLKSLNTETPEELKNQYIKGVELLNSIGKITNGQKEWFINKVLGESNLVYINNAVSYTHLTLPTKRIV